MTHVVALRGIESEKIVDGVRRKVIPFVGTDREGKSAHMGVGLLFPDVQTATLWGLISPHMLIKSWRGMKILERIEKIDHATLCACWYAGDRKIHDHDRRYLNELAKKLGGMEKLESLREEVLASMPTQEDLDSMLATLREKGVEISDWELEEELRARRIVKTVQYYELLYRSPNEFDDGSETHDIQMPQHNDTFEAGSDEEAIVHAKEVLKGGKLIYRGHTYLREAVSLKFKQERAILLN